MNSKQSEEDKAVQWLQLVNTKGIGPKRAWSIYNHVREAKISLYDVVGQDGKPGPISNISPALIARIRKQSPETLQSHLKELNKKSLRLIYPGSSLFNVPEIPSLPPTLSFIGDVSLLQSSKLVVLLKSRDTENDLMIRFLRSIPKAELNDQIWCFCPFARIDWEFVESLLKLNCRLVLGIVSGISQRIKVLSNEFSATPIAAIAPEPKLRSRWAQFACSEAFHDLFFSLSKRILVLHHRKGGKTRQRIAKAKKSDCKIFNFTDKKHWTRFIKSS